MTLSQKFESVIKMYPRNKLKYIHYKSVRNLLFQLDKFPDNHDKNKIIELLEEYINYIDEYPVITKSTDSLQLYTDYIQPVTELYRPYVNFHVTIKPLNLLIILIPVFLILFLFKIPISIYIYIIIFAALIIFRHFYYERKRVNSCIFY